MRVLLVEDDPTTSKSIELMLTHANLNVYATDLGEEGVDLAKLYDYDLILLDLDLPDMNGHEVLRQLSTGASTEVICARLQITTSTTRAHVRRILSKLGVHDRLEAVTFGLRTGMLKIARDGDPTPPEF